MNQPPGLLTSLALYAIRGYQRYLSPRKGFSCAYRCATGRDGCSGYGYRVIARFGAGTGLVLLRRRLRLCGETHRKLATAPNPRLHYQRGVCDLPCDLPCDGSGASHCDAGSPPCDCDCDPFERYRKRKKQGAKGASRTETRAPAIPSEREQIDLAYERYLLKRDGSVVTVPRLAYGLGVVFSGAGVLIASAAIWWLVLAGMALAGSGLGLIALSYRLKRRIVKKNMTRGASVPEAD